MDTQRRWNYFFVCYDQPGRGPTNANGSVLTVERDLFSLPLFISSSTNTTLFFCTVATSQIHSPLGCIVLLKNFFNKKMVVFCRVTPCLLIRLNDWSNASYAIWLVKISNQKVYFKKKLRDTNEKASLPDYGYHGWEFRVRKYSKLGSWLCCLVALTLRVFINCPQSAHGHPPGVQKGQRFIVCDDEHFSV